MSVNVIMTDTETAPMDKDFQGVSPQNMIVYDHSWLVGNKYTGEILKERYFINADVFLGEKDLMKSAYYAKKIPQYWEDIKSGKAILTSMYNIRKQFIEDIETYGVNEVYAHNMRFDYGALNNTQRWETKSKYRYFFPKDIQICDTLKMARDVIAPMPTYRKFCEENGFMTSHKTPRPQLKAETIYRFLTRNTEFEEVHKGLDDARIEFEIMRYCYRQHKKMRKALFE